MDAARSGCELTMAWTPRRRQRSDAGTPFRQLRAPHPIGRAEVGHELSPLVARTLRRIRDIRKASGAGAYLFADRLGQVYVLSDTSSTQHFLRSRTDELVGLYAAQERAMFPTVEQLQQDLIRHFFDVGFLVPGMIYGQVEHGH